MRTILVCANWKMHKDPADTTSFFERFRPLVEHSAREIVVCPPFLDVENAVEGTRGSNIRIGAQDLYWAGDGAFTGEISGSMIKASGCSHVIVGHSERRRDFGETDETVLKKTVAALDAGLTPIVCMGERDEKNVEEVLEGQFRRGIGGLSDTQFAGIVIGYEPIWAIGDGKTAAPEEAARAHALIRAQVTARFGAAAADHTRILYGGSVKSENAQALLAQSEIDGFLVGGASLDPVGFAALVNL
jgi:triosephosphate isomerase